MAVLTLNQIRNKIRVFAAGHGQIVTAKFCKQHELLEEGDIKYPALYYDLETGRKEKSQMVYSMSAIIADRINPEKDNEAEVWNDAMLIADDLLGFLDGEEDWTLEDGAPIKPFSGALGDNVSGVRVDFVLRAPFPYDRCVTPTKVSSYIITEAGITLVTEDGRVIELEDEAALTAFLLENGDTLNTETNTELIVE